jgi:hypothetical protein
MRPEPQLEELSAYLDQELTGLARQQLDAHLETCETCRRRLESLRQTVGAIQALPTEAPPRVFTIPAQREQPRRRFAPVFGWVGGATAAALVAIVVGIQLTHGLGSGSPATTAAQANSHAYLQAQPVPGAAGATSTDADRAFKAIETPFPHRAAPVSDPSYPARRIQLGTDSGTYSHGGTIRLQVLLEGAPTSTTDSKQAGLQLSLQRAGVGTALPSPVGVESYNGTPVFVGTYAVSALHLSGGPGTYTLMATWTIPDGSGVIYIAQLPIEITS